MHEGLDVVRRLMSATQDLPAVLACLHPDVEWIPARAPTEGTYHGHDGVERFFADTTESFEIFEPHYELEALAADRVLAWGTIHVRGRTSGIEMDLPSAGIFDVRDGLVTRWRDYGSRERALEAASARP